MPNSGNALPLCMTYPSQAISKIIPLSAWKECLQVWTSLLRAYLLVPLQELEQTPRQYESLVTLLVSYVGETSRTHSSLQRQETDEFSQLIFFNIHRLILTSKEPPAVFLHWTFLADLCESFTQNKASQTLVAKAYSIHTGTITDSFRELKDHLITSLESSRSEVFQTLEFNSRLLPLMRSFPAIGAYLVTGSDFIDASMSFYPHTSLSVQNRLLVLIFLGLSALTISERPRVSQFFDILYTLKAPLSTPVLAPVHGEVLISDLVNKTPILSIVDQLGSNGLASRANAVLTALEPLQKRHMLRQRHAKKSIPKSVNTNSEGILSKTSHRPALQAQMQELFPDLGSEFLNAVLEHFDNNIEAATASLLDGSYSPDLQTFDDVPNPINTLASSASQQQSTPQLPDIHNESQGIESSGKLKDTRSVTISDERRNRYDNDALDTLNVPKHRLNYGKHSDANTADSLLFTTAGKHDMKSAIMSALAAFDADDDEHDDTYDAEDVGGTIDSSVDVVGRNSMDEAEEMLYRAWIAPGGQELFSRDTATRKSAERQKLRMQSNMTDEAVEGWALMLAREPQRLRRLEKIFTDKMQSRPHSELESTKWRASLVDEDDKGTTEHGQNPSNTARGRGFAHNRSFNANNVAGSPADKATQLARQSKDVHKNTRANHNRRNQRAKKVARGGFPP